MKPTTSKKTAVYENNPFLIAIDGVKLLFERAQNTGIFLAILSLITYFFSMGNNGNNSSGQAPQIEFSTNTISAEHWPVIALIGLLVLIFIIGVALISIFVQAIADYTAAQIAKGKTVELSEASSQAGQKFLGYLWVQIIVAVKTFLWSLLLIVPGIYKANRYSLAGVTYFAEDLRGDQAVQRSQQLTDGAWITTFAGINLLNVITIGFASLLLTTGSKMILYRQFNALGKATKPAASPLSWLIFIVPAIMVLALAIIGMVAFSVNR